MTDPFPLPAPPQNPITFVPAQAGDLIRIGHNLTLRVMEDGSNTDNRLGMAELIIAPHAPGPLAHWHEMHDETFLVTKGTVRFHGAGVKDFKGAKVAVGEDEGEMDGFVDAKEGDYIVIGTKAPHTFSNPGSEEARFVNTFTPAFYVNYFKMMEGLMQVCSNFSLSSFPTFMLPFPHSLALSFFLILVPIHIYTIPSSLPLPPPNHQN